MLSKVTRYQWEDIQYHLKGHEVPNERIYSAILISYTLPNPLTSIERWV